MSDTNGVSGGKPRASVVTNDNDADPMAELYNPSKRTANIRDVDEKWKLVPAFISAKGFVRQHVTSFDHFLESELDKIVKANQEVRLVSDPVFFLRYKRITVDPPTVQENLATRPITPHECRLRDLTYMGTVKVDVEYMRHEGQGQPKIHTQYNVQIGRIPIMLRSKRCHLTGKTTEELVNLRECPLDPGGYFIVRGQEKAITVQEQQSKNRIMIEKDAQGSVMASVHSSTHTSKSKALIVCKNMHMYARHNSFSEDIPVVIMLRALGLIWDQEIVLSIGVTSDVLDILAVCLHDAQTRNVITQEQALDYIGSRMRRYGEDPRRSRAPGDAAAEFLANIFLCHIKEGEIQRDWNFRYKAAYVCVMVKRVILAMGDSTLLDDKDYFGNKRFELAGALLSYLFEDAFKMFNNRLREEAEKQLGKRARATTFDMVSAMPIQLIESTFTRAISSGNWCIARFKIDMKGVTQVLSRQSYISSLGSMTKLSSTFDKTRKVAGPRALHTSQWGMVCPSDTPEGESCGLVKNFSLLCQVTNDNEEMEKILLVLCRTLGVEDLETTVAQDMHTEWMVFLNGQLIGIHRVPAALIRGIKKLKHEGRIDPFVSVYRQEQHRAVYLGCDGGRICRPLIIVSDGKMKLTSEHMRQLSCGLRNFDDFVRDGIIEYLDVNEENDSLIALEEKNITERTTHIEIDAFPLLSVVAGLIPFPHHNQSPRNTYQCAMGKQAMGTIALNQYRRIDTVLLLMLYPQRPMCQTRTINLIGFDQLGAGLNAMVAVMSYSGYDIEDAQIHNKSSMDRGFMRCMVMRKYTTTVKPDTEEVVPPDQARTARMHALGDDGIVCKGAHIRCGDILVNKFERPRAPGEKGRHHPLVFRGPQQAVVDQVLITRSDDETSLNIKVCVRDFRRPELGDKFSSRHGQKGVCGLVVNQPDMPFNELGMCPDMIMNPHGFPSRMTVGKMIEMISGKAGVFRGGFGDGTAFHGDRISDLGRELVKYGFNYHGKDVFYSGLTGEMMPAYVFYGPIYYQKLRHMVVDKMHARAIGPRMPLTRQPTEGRARDGGLRLGEMERDCLLGYGASMLVNERLMLCSDVVTVCVCQECGYIGYSGYCQYCRNGRNTSNIEMPYACKLMIQELQGMGVRPRLQLRSLIAET
eukprot:PhM_4_TR13134/c0_g1_i1/m.14396/K03021/RPC2, POLR3B; DNA-directed RNA polymerase III subunit RPC2